MEEGIYTGVDVGLGCVVSAQTSSSQGTYRNASRFSIGVFAEYQTLSFQLVDLITSPYSHRDYIPSFLPFILRSNARRVGARRERAKGEGVERQAV